MFLSWDIISPITSAAASAAVEECSPPGLGVLDLGLITDCLMWKTTLGCKCPVFIQSFSCDTGLYLAFNNF